MYRAGRYYGTNNTTVSPTDSARTDERLLLLQDAVFFHRPAALLDGGVKVIEPPLSTLLADAARDARCNLRPLRDALFDAADDGVVLLFCPRAFDQARTENLSTQIHNATKGTRK